MVEERKKKRREEKRRREEEGELEEVASSKERSARSRRMNKKKATPAPRAPSILAALVGFCCPFFRRQRLVLDFPRPPCASLRSPRGEARRRAARRDACLPPMFFLFLFLFFNQSTIRTFSHGLLSFSGAAALTTFEIV